MNNKMSILQLLMLNIATVFFILGLAAINISVYFIFDKYIGLLATGVTLIVIALIMNHEQSQSINERRK